MDYKGMTALVTGAPAGLGEEFARQLAGRGTNLILVARSEDRLNRLAESVRQQFKMQATVLAIDLSSAKAVDRLIAEVNRNFSSIEKVHGPF
jgi:short-subunit dehydrogenase